MLHVLTLALLLLSACSGLNKKSEKKYFENSKEGFYTFGGWGRIKVKDTVILTHGGSNTLNSATADIFPEKISFFY